MELRLFFLALNLWYSSVIPNVDAIKPKPMFYFNIFNDDDYDIQEMTSTNLTNSKLKENNFSNISDEKNVTIETTKITSSNEKVLMDSPGHSDGLSVPQVSTPSRKDEVKHTGVYTLYLPTSLIKEDVKHASADILDLPKASPIKEDVAHESVQLLDMQKTSLIKDDVNHDSLPEYHMTGLIKETVTVSPITDTDVSFSSDYISAQLTKLFFLRAITDLIQQVMDTIFVTSETPTKSKLNESTNLDNNEIQHGKLRKRDLSAMESQSSSAGVESVSQTPSNTPVNLLQSQLETGPKSDLIETVGNTTITVLKSKPNVTNETIPEKKNNSTDDNTKTILPENTSITELKPNTTITNETTQQEKKNSTDHNIKTILKDDFPHDQFTTNKPADKVNSEIVKNNIKAKSPHEVFPQIHDDDNLNLKDDFTDTSEKRNPENKEDDYRFFEDMSDIFPSFKLPSQDNFDLTSKADSEESSVASFLTGAMIVVIVIVITALATAAAYEIRKRRLAQNNQSGNQNSSHPRSVVV